MCGFLTLLTCWSMQKFSLLLRRSKERGLVDDLLPCFGMAELSFSRFGEVLENQIHFSYFKSLQRTEIWWIFFLRNELFRGESLATMLPSDIQEIFHINTRISTSFHGAFVKLQTYRQKWSCNDNGLVAWHSSISIQFGRFIKNL